MHSNSETMEDRRFETGYLEGNRHQAAGPVFIYGITASMLMIIAQLFMTHPFSSTWNPWSAWLAVIVYLGFGVLAYRKTPVFFWLFFLFYFGQATAIASCAYLESGHYITEQTTYAYATGATSRLVIYNLIFFLAGLFFFTHLSKRRCFGWTDIQPVSKWGLWNVYLGTTVLLIILFTGLYIYGAPLFAGLDRLSYWLDHPMPILRSFGGQVLFLTFLLGIIYAHTRKRVTLILLFGICVYMVLQSEKFSGLLMIGYLFLLPILVRKLVAGNWQLSLKRIGMYALVIGSLFLSLAYYHYSQINVSADSSAWETIGNRVLGLQGHVWWGTDTGVMERDHAIDGDQLSKELSSFMVLSSEKEDVGMKYLISLVAPPHIARVFLDRGINFTMGYPAIGLEIFGFIGLVFLQVLAAGIVVAAVTYTYHKLVKCQLVRAAVAIKIFIEIYAVFTIGNFYQLFSPKMVAYIFVAVMLESAVYLGTRRELA